MTEKSSVEIFDENYKGVLCDLSAAAQSVGKTADDIILLAATKTQSVDTVNHAIKSGIKYIGENRVNELNEKYDFYLPVHKHFIGHLQTNKIKYVVGKCELIHSVDSLHLADEINKYAKKCGIVQDILLEVNIGNELSKSGFIKEEVNERLFEIADMGFVKVRGLMAIPPASPDKNGSAKYFEDMYKLFVDNGIKTVDNISMDILSMGMSDSFECAVKCGSNLVRLGTRLFGKRI